MSAIFPRPLIPSLFMLGGLVASTVLALPLMWRGWVLDRRESVLLLAGYFAYLYSVVS